MTKYAVQLRSETGRVFVREFESMTERVLFLLTAKALSHPPTVLKEYERREDEPEQVSA